MRDSWGGFMTPRRCFVCEESDRDGRSGENRSERSFTAKMAMAAAFRCCSANGEEQREKWSGAVFRRERRSVACFCIIQGRGRHRAEERREWAARGGETSS